MKIKAHQSLCRPERDKTINESIKLGFGSLFVERYEKNDLTSKWKYTFNGMEMFYIFLNVNEIISDKRL